MGGVAAGAQDTRVVTEPVIPQACLKLTAMLASVGDKVAEADEEKLDTARIQKALDGCKAGQAVELAVAPGKNAFLTGPLELRSGVTLLIDKGVTLFGSRDPAVYEIAAARTRRRAPIKCGTTPATAGARSGRRQAVAQGQASLRRGGCRPLIAATNVTNAAVMGDGARSTDAGYAKLKGHDFTWWEMARKAEPKDDVLITVRS